MTFDPTITFGAIINALVLLVGFVVAFTRIGGRIDLMAQRFEFMGTRLGAVEEAVKASGDFDKRLTTVEERLTNHVKMLTIAQGDISDLRHGAGFITAHRRQVDGEYS